MPRVGSLCPSQAPVAEPTTEPGSELPPAACPWPKRPLGPRRASRALGVISETAGMALAGRLTRAGEVRGL